jgi:nucleotide-binding universal stress UspA family protein
MVEIRNILCPIDFSEYSRHAVNHAVAIARWYDSTVTLFHVVPTIPAASYAVRSEIFEPIALTVAERERTIAAMRDFLDAKTADVTIETLVDEGNVITKILHQVDTGKAGLLVIGTHGRSGFEHLVLGSVTEKVLRKARCPVLSVPPRAPDVPSASPVLFKRILCPVDFSDSSRHALNYAMSLAQEADARLTVLHVMEHELSETPDMNDTMLTDRTLNVPDFLRKREQISRQRLMEVVPDTVRAYCTVETRLLPNGKPYREILRVAGEQQCDLIVIGIQGRGAVDLMFFGSTTQHVVRQARCPVLTLRAG